MFVPSLDEVRRWFATDEERACPSTEAVAEKTPYIKEGFAPWWLRTPGREQHHAACVTLDGGYYDFFDITCPTNGIRPALWVSPSVLSSHEAD